MAVSVESPREHEVNRTMIATATVNMRCIGTEDTG
jgi:hypothetical protein